MIGYAMLPAVAVIILCTLLPAGAGATILTFENDTPGRYANPFTSVDSPLVSFSEVGAGAFGEIRINDFSFATNVLGSSPGPGAPDEILMEFAVPVVSLSFSIGKSAFGFPFPFVEGWLRVFDGATQIDEARVRLDGDGLFNQVIAYDGAPITSARYAMVSEGSTDLGTRAESIDNLIFTPVPEPSSGALVALGLLAGAVRRGRHRGVA